MTARHALIVQRLTALRAIAANPIITMDGPTMLTSDPDYDTGFDLAKVCRTCGFSDCPGATGGNCPRWPAREMAEELASAVETNARILATRRPCGGALHGDCPRWPARETPDD